MSLHRPFWPHSRAYEICRSLTITHLYAPSSQGSRSCALALSFLVHAVLPPSLPSPALFRSFSVRFGSSAIAFEFDVLVLSRLHWLFRRRFQVRLSILSHPRGTSTVASKSGFVLSRSLDPSIELPSPAPRPFPATRPFRRASQVRLFYPFSSTRYFHRRFQVRLCSLFLSALALPPSLSSPTFRSFPVYFGPSAIVSESGSPAFHCPPGFSALASSPALFSSFPGHSTLPSSSQVRLFVFPRPLDPSVELPKSGSSILPRSLGTSAVAFNSCF